MEMYIREPHDLSYQLHTTTQCSERHHLEENDENHHHVGTAIIFDIPQNYNSRLAAAMVKLHPYYRDKLPIQSIALGHNHGRGSLPLLRPEQKPRWVEMWPRVKRKKVHDAREEQERNFGFLALPREIRDEIYIFLLRSSESKWAVKALDTSRTKSNMTYTCDSTQLQLTCRQIRSEVAQLVQYHEPHIHLVELGKSNFDNLLDAVEQQPSFRDSARKITLTYSKPILNGRFRHNCSFLTTITDHFVSLVKICPKVDSLFISLIANKPNDYPSKLCLFIPRRNREENRRCAITHHQHRVAEWECTLRTYFQDLQRGTKDFENMAIWKYSCGCCAEGPI